MISFTDVSGTIAEHELQNKGQESQLNDSKILQPLTVRRRLGISGRRCSSRAVKRSC